MNVLITGGCGFIGCNAAQRFLHRGDQVTVLDDLSRPGADRNLSWLRGQGSFKFIQGDVCDAALVSRVVHEGDFDAVLHLAAQVAVTTSVVNPRRDFEINALGTFNLLEAVREHCPRSVVIYASTNKVYGKLPDVELREDEMRYSLPDLAGGVGESQPLDFHSPYGCSKGSADQYVIDYSRIYGLRTINLRQSCIYGYRQFGVEDQGWVAWFTIAHLLGKPVTIYGTGKQVRDILFIDDLIDCYLAAIERIDEVAGQTFNIGGGPANTLSLRELLSYLQEFSGRAVTHSFDDWRPGDQPVYVSDIHKSESLLNWTPKVNVQDGISKLYRWIESNRGSFAELGSKL
jgi:CDP-paratose 2-epimerase